MLTPPPDQPAGALPATRPALRRATLVGVAVVAVGVIAAGSVALRGRPIAPTIPRTLGPPA
jgi:hypothetical protein